MSHQAADKTCFVIMPYGIKTAPAGESMNFDTVYKHIIKKAVDRLGLACIRSDELYQPGSIYHPMLQHIREDAVAIVDITWLNPNVFYELGVRHSLCRNVTVLIRRKGSESPFNIYGLRVIDYGLQVDEADAAVDGIVKSVQEGMKSSRTDSRVYDVFPNLHVELR